MYKKTFNREGVEERQWRFSKELLKTRWTLMSWAGLGGLQRFLPTSTAL